MTSQINTLFVFGFTGVVEKASTTHPVVGPLFAEQVSNTGCVVAVISSETEEKHTSEWQWLLKNFRILDYPKPTYLFLRKPTEPPYVAAVRHFSMLLKRFPSLQRVYCLDRDDTVLGMYAQALRASNIKLWRTMKLKNDDIHTVSSTIVDQG